MNPQFKTITIEHGQLLVTLARQSLEQFVAENSLFSPELAALPAPLCRPGASFVTLTNHGRLRGCMGTTQARFPLAEDVAQNARAAATRDPRFLPLIPAELPEVCLEVTVLSTPQPLIIADYAQLLQRLRPGIDGVILSWGQRRGLLLPQVWRRIADPDTFLEMIARKAGIPPAQLRTCPAAVAVYTFEVTHFAEPGYREPGE